MGTERLSKSAITVVLLVLGLLVNIIESYSTYGGFFRNNDQDLICNHQVAHIGTANSVQPYPVTLELSSTEYNPDAMVGRAVKVSIVQAPGQSVSTVRGFVIEARPSNPLTNFLGIWIPNDGGRQVVNCDGSQSVFISYFGNTSQELPISNFYYLPPLKNIGTIEFILTFIKDYATYWERIQIDLNLTPRNQCISNPCENSGVCFPQSGGAGYTCECAVGFIGTKCDESICDMLGSVLCLNGATCKPSNDTLGLMCMCPSLYTGTFCENVQVVTACDNVVCTNGGACNIDNTPDQFTCNCAPDFYGTYCEDQVGDACNAVVCQNGGTCNVGNGLEQFTCTCVEGFTGANCETSVTNTTNITTPEVTTKPSTEPPTEQDLTTSITPKSTTTKSTTPEVITTKTIEPDTPKWTQDVTIRQSTKSRSPASITPKSTTTKSTTPEVITTKTIEPDTPTSITPKSTTTKSTTPEVITTKTIEPDTPKRTQDVTIRQSTKSRSPECIDGYCANGGVCLDLPTRTVCVCKDDNKGRKCEIGPAFNEPLNAVSIAGRNFWWLILLGLIIGIVVILITALCVTWSKGQRRLQNNKMQRIDTGNA